VALTSYSDLQTSVAAWLHRADLTSIIPDLITIAEMRMNSDIVARDMETTSTLTTVASTKQLAMPTDVTETRRLMITSTDPRRVLNYCPPEKLVEQYPYSTTGEPEVYTVIGSNFEFGPTPDAAYTLEYVYRQRIPSLATNSTNWLMTKWPHVYLYATLCAAAPYLGQDARVGVWEDAYQKAVQDVNSVDWYSGSTMAVRAT
jgi:hypothetical protein